VTSLRPEFLGTYGSQLSQPRDVIPFLGKGKAHWNKERSAYQTAHSWFNAAGLPPSIQSILNSDSAFDGAVLKKATFEKKTKLDTHGRESQTDVLAVVNTRAGAAVLGVEAKVDESFGPIVSEWNDYTPGKLRRLVGLVERLEFKSPSTGSLRYQLFHRSVAALIEAENEGANEVAVIVQSFDKKRAGYDDFAAFTAAFGTPIEEPGRFSATKALNGIRIRFGWTENPMFYAEGD
jgi:hypothetical protein